MLHLLQAAVALALLVGLPIALETPATQSGELAATAGALVLIVIAIHGVVRFVRSRKPSSFHDSIMPPRK